MRSDTTPKHKDQMLV